jgi:methylglutaconyl-CoA hydratase
MAKSVVHELVGRVARISINRHEHRNALNDVTIRELQECISTYSHKDEARAIVLTGKGSTFCAGMDIAYLEKSISKVHEENLQDARELMRLLQSVYIAKKPVIAMVNGPAMGGGCGLAAACDFVLAAEEKAKFGVPEVRLGFVPALILTFLVKRMGEGKAREFVLQGATLTAVGAKEYGLVTEVVPAESLEARVFEFADKLASETSPTSIMLTKELFNRLSEMDMKTGMEFAANLNAMTRKTADFKKGIESFLKKENLRW